MKNVYSVSGSWIHDKILATFARSGSYNFKGYLLYPPCIRANVSRVSVIVEMVVFATLKMLK